MPLMPKRVKYRYIQRDIGGFKGNAHTGNTVEFGEFGLQSLGRGWITATQIEAARVSINREVNRRGKLWLRIFPDKPISKKPLETRLGKGKGPIEHYVATVHPGRVLFELGGVSEVLARVAFRLAASKLPVRTKFVGRSAV